MKKQKKRLLSLLMAIVMVCSLLPTMAFAEGAGACTLVTDASTLKAGDQIVIAAKANEKVYAAGALSGKFLASVETSLTDVGSDVAVFTLGGDASGWTLTSNGDKLCTSAAKAVNYSGTGTETWTISIEAEGKATIASTDSACGRILYNVNSPRFLNYTSATNASMLLPSIYKLDAGTTPDPEPEIAAISDALAASEGEFTVKGVVTLVDGKNVDLQDATGGICVYMSAAPSVELGDTIVATGARGAYRGMPQLSNGTYEASSGLTLTAKATTIGALTDGDLGTYVKLSGVEVTEVFDNNGAYSSPNVTVSDGTNTIQIYKAVVGKTDGAWDIAVGDTVDVMAAVGTNNGTLQLRNTLASEITKAAPAPTYNTIAEALAGEKDAEFTVKGVVTLLDGKNVYIQDATGGIDLYLSAAPADIALGDTVIGTGKKAEFNGLPELASATYEKSSGLELTAKATTIDALTTADICTYVKLSGVEVTEVYDKDGTYTTPNITVSDGTNTIQLYKAVVGKTDGAWDVKVGDVIDVTAAVSCYKTTLQLRNTLAS
ncbi:MAG: hypothetical protein PUC45_04005, partial [Oscillospiraceae bacterium]|nr:hypothetical protein [Oscillospiraceae bacterium]